MSQALRSPARALRVFAMASLFAGMLAGCATPIMPTMPPPPPAPAVKTPQKAAEPSPASRALVRYYAELQTELLSNGMLRTDGGTVDAPFNARTLTNNFIRIALYDEFDGSTGKLIARPTESRLRRWQAPVLVGLSFGASVPQASRATEQARVASFLARLSRITGHSIRLTTKGANFHLYVVNEDERRALGPTIKAAMPGIAPAEIAAFTDMPTSTYCQVSAMVDNVSSLYRRAFAVIRAEHPDLLHLSCLHEEISQGLGLPNDSPQARPSIFNDDQEFALLTPMDEMMLRILYDKRLRPGMRIDEARPIVQQIASEMLGGDS